MFRRNAWCREAAWPPSIGPSRWSRDGPSSRRPAPDRITELAREGDPAAARTSELFCRLLGGFAGNLALALGARGGVFIAGEPGPMAAFAREVRDGPIVGVDGEPIRDVVKIAIGGSDPGPRAVSTQWQPTANPGTNYCKSSSLVAFL